MRSCAINTRPRFCDFSVEILLVVGYKRVRKIRRIFNDMNLLN